MAEESLVKMKRRRGKEEEEEEPPLAKKGKIENSSPANATLLSLSDDVLLGVLR